MAHQLLALQRLAGNRAVRATVGERSCACGGTCPSCATGRVGQVQRQSDDEVPEASAPEASAPEASAPEASAPEASAPEATLPAEPRGADPDEAPEPEPETAAVGETSEAGTESAAETGTATAEAEGTEIAGVSPDTPAGAGETEIAGATAGSDADAPVELEAVCAGPEGHGAGGGVKINLHGDTAANYNHGRPVPAPFPSTVTVTTRTVGKAQTKVFDASGTFDVTFKASPTVTLPSVPSGLTSCQQKAAQDFIDGPLTAHEDDHKTAFTDNYDGTFAATVSASNILDTTEMRKRAMENPVMSEDQTRTATANKASAKLDPWKKTVPGLDCKD